MQPALQVPPDELPRLRQQLILAQAKLLELEDTREALLSRITLLDRTLADLQTLANGKIAERDHQAARTAELERHTEELETQRRQILARTRELEEALAETAKTAANGLDQIRVLEAELSSLQSSLSWRLTRPLRRLGRWFCRSP
jgi:hypothetical protein